MANALRALIQWYRTGEDADRVKYDIAWVQDKDVAGRHDQRLHRGLPRCARRSRARGKRSSSTSTRRRPTASASSPTTRSGSRTSMPCDPKYRKPSVKGIVANAIDVVVETGDSGPVTPVGINLPNDQTIREKLRQQVGVAVERQRGLRQVHAGHDARRVRVDARGGRARGDALRHARRRAAHRHARGDRPRLGPAGRGIHGDAAGGDRRSIFSALEEGRADLVGAVFPRRPEAGRARHPAGRRPRRTSCRPSTRPTRATRWCSCAACARARRSRKTTCATAR